MLRGSSRIILGTAQFGLHYGVANVMGQPSQGDVRRILDRARSGGIKGIDTAISYGESERVLGVADVQGFEVISKLPQIPNTQEGGVSAWMNTQVQGSLARLRVDCLDGLLLHRPEQLLTAQGTLLYRALQEQVSNGRVRKIGVSIYDPSDLDRLIPRFDFDIVQAPFNILDARFVRSGWLTRLRKMGIALHIRSVFLQGLLLMPAERRPVYFERWEPIWAKWGAWLRKYHLTPLQACLRYALHVDGVERVILGVDSAEQLDEILAIADEGAVPDGYQSMQTQDVDLLNPTHWKAL